MTPGRAIPKRKAYLRTSLVVHCRAANAEAKMNSVLLITIMASSVLILISVLILAMVLKRRQTITTTAAMPSQLLPKGSGEVFGHPFSWQHSGASQNKSPYLKLTLPCRQEGRFIIRRETGFDRLGKRIGLVNEIAVHEELFDSAHFIDSPHPLYCSQLLGHSGVRSAVRRLLARGFTQLYLGKGGLTLQWANYRPKKNAIQPQEISALAEELVEIKKGCDRISLNDEDRLSQRSWQRLLSGLYALSGLALLVGLTTMIWGLTAFTPLDPGQIFLFSLKWSLPAFALFLLISYSSVKGNSSAHSHMLGLFFLSLAGLILLGFGTTIFLNGQLDQSPPAAHSALVIHKHYTKSKNNYTYHLTLESWREGRENEGITVSRSSYERVSVNEDLVNLVTRAGYLGFEWTVSYWIETP